MNFTKPIWPVDDKTEPNYLNQIALVKRNETFHKKKSLRKFQACNYTIVLQYFSITKQDHNEAYKQISYPIRTREGIACLQHVGVGVA